MKITKTGFLGVVLIELDPRVDARGSLCRTWCRETFAALGLVSEYSQANLVKNPSRGTLRGLHYQDSPGGETKVVHCLRGSLFDVVVDVRPGSPSRGKHMTFQLSADRPTLLYIPGMMAHGYQTLEDETWVHYLHSSPYSPPHERGVRWDDPGLHIDWPLEPILISDRDRQLPRLGDNGAPGGH